MSVSFKCFARARELANTNLIQLVIPSHSKNTTTNSTSTSLYQMLQQLVQQYPGFDMAFFERCRFALNHKYIANVDAHTVCDGDVYTIVPPISGG